MEAVVKFAVHLAFLTLVDAAGAGAGAAPETTREAQMALCAELDEEFRRLRRKFVRDSSAAIACCLVAPTYAASHLLTNCSPPCCPPLFVSDPLLLLAERCLVSCMVSWCHFLKSCRSDREAAPGQADLAIPRAGGRTAVPPSRASGRCPVQKGVMRCRRRVCYAQPVPAMAMSSLPPPLLP